MVYKLFFLVLAILYSSVSAYAAVPAVCGDGLVGTGEGGDTYCQGTDDKDRDGFKDTEDCNDQNRWVYPGVFQGCGVDGTQYCQADGAWSVCTEGELCEAVGNGRCFYVDPVSGNDSNNGQSRVTAWRTFERIRSYTQTVPPPGHISLIPGDVIYFMGGTHSTTYPLSANSEAIMNVQGVAGTAAAPISFKAYPGQTVRIDPGCSGPGSCVGFEAITSDHIKFLGNSIPIEITGAWDRGIFFAEGESLEIANVWVHSFGGNAGTQGTNTACIRLQEQNGFNRLHHYLIHDCFDPTEPSDQNNANLVVFNSSLNWSGSWRVDHGVSYNSVSGTGSGHCLKFKHGNDLGTTEVDHNLLYNCHEAGLSSNDAANHFHHNLVHTSDYCFVSRNLGGEYRPTTNVIENNTCIDTHGIHVRWDEHLNNRSDWGNVTSRNNIFVDGGVVYGDSTWMNNFNHYFHIPQGGTIFDIQQDYLTVVPSKLDLHDNCYWNNGLQMRFSVWGSQEGQTPNFGNVYDSFTQWVGSGYESGSFAEDPALDSMFEATSANCAGKGWVLAKDGGDPDPDPVPFDYTADGVSDLTVWRPTNGTWYIRDVQNSTTQSIQWGLATDKPIYGDFDNDGAYDPAVWREYSYNISGVWYSTFYLKPSGGVCPGTSTPFAGGCSFNWGLAGDKAVPADYNGDGQAEFAVWRPSSGNWFLASGQVIQWGLATDKPVPGDYDGDGLADPAVYRPNGLLGSGFATFFVLPSSGTCPSGFLPFASGCSSNWGLSTDLPVIRDYDGDGKADPAVWRASNATYYLQPSGGSCPGGSTPYFSGCDYAHGLSTDKPVPAQYSSDGVMDFAVWSPLPPNEGVWFIDAITNFQWGLNGDIPAGN